MLHNTMYVGTAALSQLRIYNSQLIMYSYDSLPAIILGHLNVVGVYDA